MLTDRDRQMDENLHVILISVILAHNVKSGWGEVPVVHGQLHYIGNSMLA